MSIHQESPYRLTDILTPTPDLEKEIEAEAERQRALERRVWQHLLEALTYAEERHRDASVAFQTCEGLLHQIRDAYYEATRTPKPPPKRSRSIPTTLRKQVYERDAYRCVHCGTHIDLTLDHIVPFSKGGDTTLDNLQTLCQPCNSRKRDRQ